MPMLAFSKKASEIENASSTSRSRCSIRNGRLRSMKGTKNKRHSGTQSQTALILRPNAPA